jgi:hypothetical protein
MHQSSYKLAVFLSVQLLQMPNFSSAVPLVDPVYRNALQLLREASEGNQVGARAQDWFPKPY